MNISCPKEILTEKIGIAQRGISSRTTMPILECLLITAGPEGVRLMSNDLEMGVETAAFEANVIEEGSLALDARIFSDIIKRMPDGGEVSIISDENNATVIKCLKTKFKIPGQPSYEFPALPVFEKSGGHGIKAQTLKNMIRQTIFAVSVDESKPVLTGELFEAEGDTLTAVAVDGYRVAYRKEVLENSSGDFRAVIPSRTLNEISRILSGEDIINFYFTDKHCLFELSGAVIVTRLLEGEFLKYRQVFTEDFKTRVTLNKDELADSLERALLIARDTKKNPVKLIIGDDLVSLSSLTELGASYDEIRAETDGEPLEIGFNPRYLLDCLKSFDDEIIHMGFTGSLAPCLVYGADPESAKHLVLPLRLKY